MTPAAGTPTRMNCISTTLSGPGDWDEWNQEVQDLLKSMGCWEVVTGYAIPQVMEPTSNNRLTEFSEQEGAQTYQTKSTRPGSDHRSSASV